MKNYELLDGREVQVMIANAGLDLQVFISEMGFKPVYKDFEVQAWIEANSK